MSEIYSHLDDDYYDDPWIVKLGEIDERKKREAEELVRENTPINIVPFYDYSEPTDLSMTASEALREMAKRNMIKNRLGLEYGTDTEFTFSMSPETPYQIDWPKGSDISNLSSGFYYLFDDICHKFVQNQVFTGKLIGARTSQRFSEPIAVVKLNSVDRFRLATDYAEVWMRYLYARLDPRNLQREQEEKRKDIKAFVECKYGYVAGFGYPDNIAFINLHKENQEASVLYTFERTYPFKLLPHKKRIADINGLSAFVDLRQKFNINRPEYKGVGIPLTFPDFRTNRQHQYFLITPEELSKFNLEVVD
jgi:hypothetical protein